MPIPKAACTSVKSAFASLDRSAHSAEAPTGDPEAALHIRYPTSRFRPHRLQGFCDGSWWRIAVVRDPVKRLLSVYTNRVLDKQDLRRSPKMRDQTRLPTMPDPDFFFQNLQDYMALSSAIKHHALTARLFVGPAPLRYDRIYRTDELDQLSADLSERTGRRVRIPKANKSQTTLELGQLKDATVAAIKTHLDEDYALLRSFFPYPFEGKPNPEIQSLRLALRN